MCAWKPGRNCLRRAPFSPVRGVCIAILLAAPGVSVAQDLCSDYLSWSNCINKRRPQHYGIDFGGVAGTEVISATHGTVTQRNFDECSGHGLTVRTDFRATHEDKEGPVFVRYAHVEGYANVVPGLKLKPGDPIGTTIPLRHTPCHGSREHVHYELRVFGNARRHINPHPYWVDGEGRPTCFRDGMIVPPGKAVVPIRCKP
jgi:murein DD-endopeptidase MepM/ murein hydrolase activator NlpD